MNRLTRRLGTVIAAAVVASPALALPATQASASVPAISASSFGMHYINTGHAYPKTAFASARIWDMAGVKWQDLQPNAPTHTLAGPLGVPAESWTDGFDANAVSKLDSIVQTFANYHVDPMITLGMTPA